MVPQPQPSWFSNLLWRLTLLAAIVLIGLVILAPLLDNGKLPLLKLFASDKTVRRTAIACALGLIVTGCIFFRRPAATLSPNPLKNSDRLMPPPGPEA